MGRWFSYFLNRKECITIASTELKTSVTYEATGEQTVFNIPFDYLRNSFVKAKIGDDGEPMEYGTDYEVANRQITFTTAPVGMLYVYRETPTDRMVQFMEGSVLKANDMNISTLQQLHIIEENEDWMIDNSFVPNEDKNWDAKDRRIINTADPVNAQDVVTKNYMETVQSGFVQQNTALKDESTKQANIATQKAQLATEKADTATQQADRAQAWAESEESPDSEIDADSPTGDTMSSKEWALYAKQLAQQIGNPVNNVTEKNGKITIKHVNGDNSSFFVGAVDQSTKKLLTSNYDFSTQEEAEQGNDLEKPLNAQRVKQAIEYNHNKDTVVMYINGGTAEKPAEVTINSRYVEKNPFTGYYVSCIVEILLENEWAQPFMSYVSTDNGGRGVTAGLVNENIIIQTGRNYLKMAGYDSGSLSTSAETVKTAPCRVIVSKLGKKG